MSIPSSGAYGTGNAFLYLPLPLGSAGDHGLQLYRVPSLCEDRGTQRTAHTLLLLMFSSHHGVAGEQRPLCVLPSQEPSPWLPWLWSLTCCEQLASISQLVVTSCPVKVGDWEGMVNVWGVKYRGRELRVGGRQIKSPMISVGMVPRGSGVLGITAKCIFCRGVHSEQGASLCMWPLDIVWSDPYSCSRVTGLLQSRWGH